MSQKNSRSQDEISRLLDSFEVGDTLEEKMDTFKQEKQRKTRIDKARKNQESFQRQYTEELDLTRVMDPVEDTYKYEDEDSNTMRTMTWDRNEIEDEFQDTNKTVVINDDEIQSLLDEDKGPKLTREVRRKKPRKSSNSNNRTILIVLASVVGILLSGLLIFGVFKLIGGFGEDDKITEQQQKENYHEILSWANDYDQLSDSQKEKIIEFESKFNKLTDKQQDKINEVLKDLTGRSFDELLAKSKSDAKDKEDSKNDNTKIAEKKAKLRKEIGSLQSALDSLQGELDSANASLAEVQAKLDAETQNKSNIQYQIDSCNASITELDASNANLKIQKDDLYRQYLDLSYDDPQREPLWAQIESINSQVQQNTTDIATYKTDLANAQSSLKDVNSTISDIQKEVDSAKKEVESIQSKYDSKHAQIEKLKSQLERLESEK